MDHETARTRLAFALDYPDLDAARHAAQTVAGHVGVLKIGLELFARHGADALTIAAGCDRPVFLDLKLHDIPATVARAVASAGAHTAVRYLTVHAGGGSAMLQGAVQAAKSSALEIVAVTVLTSLSAEDLALLGVAGSPAEHVERLAKLAWAAGVRRFVCSPHEAPVLRKALGGEAFLITPGVRPEGASPADQKRVMTPAQAIAAGADMLVVGRPIRDAADPAAAAANIVEQIASAPGGLSA